MAHILLADDDEDMVEICSRLLPRRGHRLTVATNAAEAVALAEANLPELILMDMRMPVSGTGDVSDRAGLDAVREIKKRPALQAVPIIALTGHIMKTFRAEISEAGCAGLLPKPIENFAQLMEAIERGLNGTKGP